MKAKSAVRRRPESPAAAARDWSYPYYSLADVIEFARIAQRTGGRDVAEKQLLKKMGISNRVTHSWSYRLSSAKQFGLIVRTRGKEDARLELTELGGRVLSGPSERRKGALEDAFRRPLLYRKLAERYLDVPAPSVEDLASVLVRDFGLLESVGERAARAFLDSARYAGVTTPNGCIGSAASGEEPPGPRSPRKAAIEPEAQATTDVGSSADDLIAHGFQLRPEVRIVVRLPADLKQSDVTRLHKWLRTLPFEDSEE